MGYLEKLHAEVLSIMDEIDSFCRLKGIQYYIVGGTLLGAIRHGGFIPWDDDLDIAMPRKDFDKFIDCFSKDKSSDFYVESKYTNTSFIYGLAKVYKKGTVFEEAGGYANPIFVDIFPLDDSNGYSKKVDKIKKRYWRLENMRMRRVSRNGKSIKNLISKVFGRYEYKEVLKRTVSKNNGKGYEYYTNYLSQYSANRQTMPKKWYGKGVEVKFEDKKYLAPKEYEKFLKQLYGVKYMEIPPIQKRRTHYPLYVKFSNGEELHFDEPNKRVTIEDTLG